MKLNMALRHGGEDKLLHSLVLEALAHSLSHDEFAVVVEEGRKEAPEGKGCILDVRLTANGRDLDIQHVVQLWESQMDRIIAKKASELLTERLPDLQDIMVDLDRVIREKVREAFPEIDLEDR